MRPGVGRDPSFNMLAHGRRWRQHGLPPGFQGLSATSRAVASGEGTRSDGDSAGGRVRCVERGLGTCRVYVQPCQ